MEISMAHSTPGRTTGPAWIKIGSSVRYPQENLDLWIDQQIQDQTGNSPEKNTNSIPKASKRLLTEKEAAAYISMSVAYLRRDRLQGRAKAELPTP